VSKVVIGQQIVLFVPLRNYIKEVIRFHGLKKPIRKATETTAIECKKVSPLV